MANFRAAFPEFAPDTMPAIPAGFVDNSLHKNACPSFINENLGLVLWVDYADPSLSELADLLEDESEYQRFHLDRGDEGEVLASNDWQEIMTAIVAAGEG